MNPLLALIVDVLRQNPHLKGTPALVRELEKYEGRGVIVTVNEAKGIIEWEGEERRARNREKHRDANETKISALKDWMTLARKKIRSG